MNTNETQAFMVAGKGSVKLVFEYLDQLYPIVETIKPRPNVADRDIAIIRLWMRARHWLGTVTRLDRLADIQAASVAYRTLLELAVDMMLVAKDQTNEAGLRLTLWAESERVKHFENVVHHYQSRNLPLPQQFAENLESHNTVRPAMETIRKHHWPLKKDPTKAKHPERWTANNLFDDMVSLDESPQEEAFIMTCVRMPLSALYREEIKPVNWCVHSGVAGPWGTTEVGVLQYFLGNAYDRCADFGLLCTMVLLNEYAKGDVAAKLLEDFMLLGRKRNELTAKAREQFGV